MDVREILVANTKTQKKYKINTNASTLGELKEAFDDAGIDYEGMTFTEGISKTQLLDDATQLPQNLTYKGQQTNNLVILLTNTKKNIASGAMSRKEAYQAIKDNNLQDAVKEEFGKNFTQVTTSELILFLEKNTKPTYIEEEETPKAETPVEEEVKTPSPEGDADTESSDDEEEETKENTEGTYTVDDIIADADTADLEDSLFLHVAMLVQHKALDKGDIQALIKNLEWLSECMDAKTFSTSKPIVKPTQESVSSSDGSITDNDIDDMLDDLGM